MWLRRSGFFPQKKRWEMTVWWMVGIFLQPLPGETSSHDATTTWIYIYTYVYVYTYYIFIYIYIYVYMYICMHTKYMYTLVCNMYFFFLRHCLSCMKSWEFHSLWCFSLSLMFLLVEKNTCVEGPCWGRCPSERNRCKNMNFTRNNGDWHGLSGI